MSRIDVRPLAAFVDQRAAAELYRTVFGYTDSVFTVSPRLLRGLLDNGGTAIGAFEEGGRLVGFCYGFTALDAGRVYHYSQATVVAPEAQGIGVGGRLKRSQAQSARALGASSMRWTFDPRLSRNARFNLNALGAVGTRFLPQFYDEPDTDRMLVEWPLDPDEAQANRERASALSSALPLAPRATRPTTEEPATEELTTELPPAHSLLRWVAIPSGTVGFGDELATLFDEGYRALACATVDPGTARAARRSTGARYIFGRS